MSINIVVEHRVIHDIQGDAIRIIEHFPAFLTMERAAM